MMTLEELMKFLNGLPERFNTYGVVNGEVGSIPSEDNKDEEETVYRCDKPIVTLYVDENTKEVCFFHQTDKEITDIAGEAYFGSDDTEEETKDKDFEDPEETLS